LLHRASATYLADGDTRKTRPPRQERDLSHVTFEALPAPRSGRDRGHGASALVAIPKRARDLRDTRDLASSIPGENALGDAAAARCVRVCGVT
jgi:hypothetical protein